MKTAICKILIFSALAFTSCDETILHVEEEYYITWNFEISTLTNDYFRVINVHTGKFKNIPAVMELEGTYYLPIMSRMPSYHNKIVNGYFFIDQPLSSMAPDTVFKVTKHVRDTTIILGKTYE